MTQLEAELVALNDYFGTTGQFVALCQLLNLGKSVTDAARTLQIAPKKARETLKNVGVKYGLDSINSIYTTRLGRRKKTGQDRDQAVEVVSLSLRAKQISDRLLKKLRELNHSVEQLEDQNVPTTLRIAIAEGIFLNSILSPLTIDSQSSDIGLPVRTSLSRDKLKDKIQKGEFDKFDLAVTWSSGNDPELPVTVRDDMIEQPEFELLVIFKEATLRGKVATRISREHDRWQIDPEKLAESKQTVGYPEHFLTVKKWLQKHGIKNESCPSFGQIFSKVLSGELACGFIVDHYALLDYFRMSRLIHYAIPKNFNPKIYVTLLSNNACTPQIFNRIEEFRHNLVRKLNEVRYHSPFRSLTTPEKHNPENIKSLSADYYCYFFESISNQEGQEESEWLEEVARIDFQKKQTSGGHTFRLQADSKLLNQRFDFFNLQGGIIGERLLYVVANSDCETPLGEIVNHWPHAKKFVKHISKDRELPERTHEASSFLAILPYFEVKTVDHEQQYLWWGFWLGMDDLTHPLANGMAISSKPLTRDDCEEIRDKIRIRYMYAGAGISGQSMIRT